MNLIHIDHNFYKLTSQQAKRLAVENNLPKHGYERKANPEALKQVTLGHIDRLTGKWAPTRGLASEIESAWIQRTPLSWFYGKTIRHGWTWALHVRHSFASFPLTLN